MVTATPEGGMLHLIIKVEAGGDPDECDLLTRELRAELLEQGTASFEPVSAEKLPPGTKAAEAITLGMLALAVLPAFLPKLIEYLNSWTMRVESRKIRVKAQVGDRSLELEYMPTAISEKELMDLVQKLTGTLADKPQIPASKQP